MVYLSIVKYFIEQQKCDPNSTNNKEQTPLHCACQEGEIDIAQYLFQDCAVDIDSKDKEGTTPFLEAVMNGHLTLVEYLIKQGCDLLQANCYGNTPVHLAALNGHLSIVKYFIDQQKCDPNIINKIEQTPLHLACDKEKLILCNT